MAAPAPSEEPSAFPLRSGRFPAALVAAHSQPTYCGWALCYSGTTSPEPPNSLGKSFNLVSPSLIDSTVSA
jgi:hypothetical protein